MPFCPLRLWDLVRGRHLSPGHFSSRSGWDRCTEAPSDDDRPDSLRDLRLQDTRNLLPSSIISVMVDIRALDLLGIYSASPRWENAGQGASYDDTGKDAKGD